MKEVKKLKSGFTTEEQVFWESVLGRRFLKGTRKLGAYYMAEAHSIHVNENNVALGYTWMLNHERVREDNYFTVPKEFTRPVKRKERFTF